VSPTRQPTSIEMYSHRCPDGHPWASSNPKPEQCPFCGSPEDVTHRPKDGAAQHTAARAKRARR
jgi:hypothetical protein